MKRIYRPTFGSLFLTVIASLSVCILSSHLHAQSAAAPPVLKINAGQVTAKVSPTLYGLMTEEINYSYEGGLYGELIRNRSFKANADEPKYWAASGSGVITLDTNMPLNEALNVSLKLDAARASKGSPAGISNSGYWGIPVRPKTTYHASFYAKAAGVFDGPLNVAIVSTNGTDTFAEAEVSGFSGQWKK
jgi:alpha-L-arabinofuranosidase